MSGLWTLLLAPFAIFTCVFDRGHTAWRMVRHLWAPLVLRVFGQELRVVGAERVDPGRPAVYFANHQSSLDAAAIFCAVPVNLRFLCKQSLRFVPALGQYLSAAGHIFIDRGDAAEARRSLALAARKVRRGRSLLIFPEGTRSRDGRLQPLKKGAFVLAIEAGVPLVPIALRGSWEALGGGFRPTPGCIEVRVGAPLSTAGLGYDDRDAVRDRAEQALRELMG